MHPTANYCDEMLAGARKAVGCAFSFKSVIFHCELKWGEIKEKKKGEEGRKRGKNREKEEKERRKGGKEGKGREKKATGFYFCSSSAAFAPLIRNIFH